MRRPGDGPLHVVRARRHGRQVTGCAASSGNAFVHRRARGAKDGELTAKVRGRDYRTLMRTHERRAGSVLIMMPNDAARAAARAALVNEHIRLENLHDVDAIMTTFGEAACYDDAPWGDRRAGLDGVRSYYTELIRALPDLAIEVTRQHVASASVVVEVIIRGTHLGPWRGLPATGRRLEFPLCGVFEFDLDDKLGSERIYYDRGAVLRQLGLFHEPAGALGRAVMGLSHPVTIGRAWLRRLFGGRAASGPGPTL